MFPNISETVYRKEFRMAPVDWSLKVKPRQVKAKTQRSYDIDEILSVSPISADRKTSPILVHATV